MLLSSNLVGYCPLKAKIGVQIPVGVPKYMTQGRAGWPARSPHKAEDGGSNPPPATKITREKVVRRVPRDQIRR